METDHQEKRHLKLVDRFIQAPMEVGDRMLRGLSPATFILLKRTRNGLFLGADKNSADGVRAAIEFAFMHGAPIEEVTRLTTLPTPREAARELCFPIEEFRSWPEEEQAEMIEAVMLRRFRAAAMEWGSTLEMDISADIADHAAAETDAAQSAMVEVAPPDSKETDDPNSPSQPGSKRRSGPSHARRAGPNTSSSGS